MAVLKKKHTLLFTAAPTPPRFATPKFWTQLCDAKLTQRLDCRFLYILWNEHWKTMIQFFDIRLDSVSEIDSFSRESALSPMPVSRVLQRRAIGRSSGLRRCKKQEGTAKRTVKPSEKECVFYQVTFLPPNASHLQPWCENYRHFVEVHALTRTKTGGARSHRVVDLSAHWLRVVNKGERRCRQPIDLSPFYSQGLEVERLSYPSSWDGDCFLSLDFTKKDSILANRRHENCVGWMRSLQ